MKFKQLRKDKRWGKYFYKKKGKEYDFKEW